MPDRSADPSQGKPRLPGSAADLRRSETPPPEGLYFVPSAELIRTDEPLIWFAGAGREYRTSRSYYYDARDRTDAPHLVLQLTLSGTGFYRRKAPGQPLHLLTPNKAFLDFIPGPFEYGLHVPSAGQLPPGPPGPALPAGGPVLPAGGPVLPAGSSAGEPAASAARLATPAHPHYDLVYISFRGKLATRLGRQIHATFGPVLDFGASRDVLDTMLALVSAAEQAATFDRYTASSQLYGLLMQVMAVLSRSRVTASLLAERALRIIDARSADPAFNVTALATELDCSREHLAREFRRAVGVAPLEYLSRRRVALAANLLRTGTHKLDTVAARSGFSSAVYLCRLFRKKMGITPARFRTRPWIVTP